MRKVFDAYRNSLGLKMLALYTWSASIFSRVYVTHTHIQNFKFDLNIQPNKSNHDNPRQNAEARWWPKATTEPRRFGGIEMRLHLIQIWVFPTDR